MNMHGINGKKDNYISNAHILSTCLYIKWVFKLLQLLYGTKSMKVITYFALFSVPVTIQY